jgi:hypothetical protein
MIRHKIASVAAENYLLLSQVHAPCQNAKVRSNCGRLKGLQQA